MEARRRHGGGLQQLLSTLAAVVLAGLSTTIGQQLQLDDVSQYNDPSRTFGATPDQLPWIDFSRPPADGFTCWELGLGQRYQAGQDQPVDSPHHGETVEFEVQVGVQQTLDLSCLGGGTGGMDGSGAVFSAGVHVGDPSYELLLVATPSRAGSTGATEVTFDLTRWLQAGGITPQRAHLGGSTRFDALLPSVWTLRLRNLNRLVKISLDLHLGFDASPASPPCEVCDVGVCSDCKSCVGLGATDGGGPDARCAMCYSQIAGAACLAVDYSMCETKCWSGRAGNVPIVLVNPMLGSSLYMEWDKPRAALCDHRSNGLRTVWPPALADVGTRITCSFDDMKLVWDDALETYADRGIRTVNVPPGAPPRSDALTMAKVWPSVVEKLEQELGYSALTQMRVVSYDWRMGARHFAQPGGAFDKTKKVFEESRAVHGRASLVISFSMGSPFFHSFLQQQTQLWKDEHVAGWTTLAGPFAGSMQLFMTMVGGGQSIIGDDFVPNHFPGVDAYKIRDTMASWGVGAFMSPRPTTNLADNAITMALVEDHAYTFEAGNVREILALAAAVQPRGPAAGDSDADSDSAQRTLEVHDYEYAYSDTTAPPGVAVWCLYSLGSPTVSSFSYDTPDMSGEPTPSNSEGDSTVHRQSLEVCTTWADPDHDTTVHRLADGVIHGDTAKSDEALALLVTIASSFAQSEGSKYGVDCLGVETEQVNAACPEITAASHASCSRACAGAFLLWWTACEDELPDSVVATFSDFVAVCSAAAGGGH